MTCIYAQDKYSLSWAFEYLSFVNEGLLRLLHFALCNNQLTGRQAKVASVCIQAIDVVSGRTTLFTLTEAMKGLVPMLGHFCRWRRFRSNPIGKSSKYRYVDGAWRVHGRAEAEAPDGIGLTACA